MWLVSLRSSADGMLGNRVLTESSKALFSYFCLLALSACDLNFAFVDLRLISRGRQYSGY